MEYQVKNFGRTFLRNEIRWCGHSGSGIGFHFTGKRLELELWGDNSTEGFVTEGKARVGIFINGERFRDQMVTQRQEIIEIIHKDSPVSVDIEIIKLSESAMTTMGIGRLTTDLQGRITPLPDRAFRMEIIGDSITCGYGVDARNAEETFSTETEDVTRAYSYRLARALDADYSMVCFSGYGIVSGYTATGERNTRETLPQYYDRTGFSYASPASDLKLEQTYWDFSSFVPQLIVINLGTNDATYTHTDPVKIAEYKEQYIQFLKLVRSKNPRAEILCVVGIMGETLTGALKELTAEYAKETGDYHVHYAGLKEQLPEDGYGADSHPSQKTHEKLARLLESIIRDKGII